MDSELPPNNNPSPPLPRKGLKGFALEATALSIATTAVLVVVVHQSLIGNLEIYRNRFFVLVEFLAVISLWFAGLATFVKTVVLATERNPNTKVPLLVTFVVGVMFLFCFWYDGATLLYAT